MVSRLLVAFAPVCGAADDNMWSSAVRVSVGTSSDDGASPWAKAGTFQAAIPSMTAYTTNLTHAEHRMGPRTASKRMQASQFGATGLLPSAFRFPVGPWSNCRGAQPRLGFSRKGHPSANGQCQQFE